MRSNLFWLGVATLLLILAFLFLSGCSPPKVVLHPIEPADIFSIPKGAEVEWEDDLMIVEKDGWFVSDYYMKEVMKAKVE